MDFTIFACVIQNRVYRVNAANQDDAEQLFREDYNLMEYDLVDAELDSLSVEDFE